MPRHPDQNGYPLPVPVDDGSRLCVVVRVPNIRGHRQAFLGAVSELTHAYTWGNDDAHTALEVSALWKNIFDEMLETFYDDECGDNPMKCCTPDITIQIIHRINPDTGAMEISNDNGANWYPDPASLPSQVVNVPPVLTGSSEADKCRLASNGMHRIKEVVEAWGNGIRTIALIGTLLVFAVEALAAALLIILGQQALEGLVVVVGEFARKWFASNPDDYDALFTEEVYHSLLCILQCNIGSDGTFSAAEFSEVLSQLDTVLPGGAGNKTAGETIRIILKGWQEQGLNNACAIDDGNVEDCADCSCACDLTEWVIQAGTLIERDETHITLATVDFGGSFIATIHAPGINGCCILDVAATGAGSPVPTYGWKGEAFQDDPRDYPHTSATDGCNAASMFGAAGGVLDTVTFTVTGDCED